jgi:tetratricopeptide (TPR) repeat protein
MRPKQITRKKNRASRTVANSQEPKREQTPSSESVIHGWKKWALRGCLAFATPCLFLLLLEASLRIAGYGYPSSCFLKKEADGQVVYIENSKFELRFFPPALIRLPSAYTVPAHKAPNTYRIFVIGSSAAAGFPEPAYSFSRILEVILKAKHPETHLEVINTATTAINSNVDLPIVEEAAKHQPDLFVVYDGHNEVLGPFGPETLFVPYSSSLSTIRSTVFIKSTKIGQLLDSLRLRLTKNSVPVEWHGMEMVVKNQLSRDDPRLQVVYSHFRSNLTDIVHSAHHAGARVILATLSTNLKDAAPFASLHVAHLSPYRQVEWDQQYRNGIDAESQGKFETALGFYLNAARIDDQFADLQFRLARVYQNLHDDPSALQHYIQARDDDALRFRADSMINQLIRQVASSEAANGVSLVDMEQLAQTSALPAPGADLFYDHVHMNFSGNYLLARNVSDQIDRILSGSSQNAISEEDCARKLAYTDWNRGAIAKDLLPLLQEVPFTNQLNHDEQIDLLKQRMKELFANGTPQIVNASRAIYEQAVQAAPDDWMLRNQYGILLADSGDSPGAAEQFRKVEALLPYRSWPHVALAQVLAKSSSDDAIREYLQALQADPDSRNAHLGLAALFLEQGKPADALMQYQSVLRNNPQNPQALVGEGVAWSQQGKTAQAREAYERVLRSNPSLPESHYRLGELLLRQGSTDDAIAHLQRAVELNFAYADAHVSLGEALEAKSEWEQALEQYLNAAAVDPIHLELYYARIASLLNRTGRHAAAELALGDAYSAEHKWSDAAFHYSEAVKVNSGVAQFHFRLAAALHNLGREKEARSELTSATRLDPQIAEKENKRSADPN